MWRRLLTARTRSHSMTAYTPAPRVTASGRLDRMKKRSTIPSVRALFSGALANMMKEAPVRRNATNRAMASIRWVRHSPTAPTAARSRPSGVKARTRYEAVQSEVGNDGPSFAAGNQTEAAVRSPGHDVPESVNRLWVAEVHCGIAGSRDRKVQVGEQTQPDERDAAHEVRRLDEARFTVAEFAAASIIGVLPCPGDQQHGQCGPEQNNRLLMSGRQAGEEPQSPQCPHLRAVAIPLDGEKQQRDGEEIVERKHLRHQRIGPESGRDGEGRAGGEAGDGGRRTILAPRPARIHQAGGEDGDQADGRRLEKRRQEVHDHGRRPGPQVGGHPADHRENRVPRRMCHAAEVGNRDELAGIPRGHGRSQGGDVDAQRSEADGNRRQPCPPDSGRALLRGRRSAVHGAGGGVGAFGRMALRTSCLAAFGHGDTLPAPL